MPSQTPVLLGKMVEFRHNLPVFIYLFRRKREEFYATFTGLSDEDLRRMEVGIIRNRNGAIIAILFEAAMAGITHGGSLVGVVLNACDIFRAHHHLQAVCLAMASRSIEPRCFHVSDVLVPAVTQSIGFATSMVLTHHVVGPLIVDKILPAPATAAAFDPHKAAMGLARFDIEQAVSGGCKKAHRWIADRRQAHRKRDQ